MRGSEEEFMELWRPGEEFDPLSFFFWLCCYDFNEICIMIFPA